MELFQTLMSYVVALQLVALIILAILIKLNSHTMPRGRQDVSEHTS